MLTSWRSSVLMHPVMLWPEEIIIELDSIGKKHLTKEDTTTWCLVYTMNFLKRCCILREELHVNSFPVKYELHIEDWNLQLYNEELCEYHVSNAFDCHYSLLLTSRLALGLSSLLSSGYWEPVKLTTHLPLLLRSRDNYPFYLFTAGSMYRTTGLWSVKTKYRQIGKITYKRNKV